MVSFFSYQTGPKYIALDKTENCEISSIFRPVLVRAVRFKCWSGEDPSKIWTGGQCFFHDVKKENFSRRAIDYRNTLLSFRTVGQHAEAWVLLSTYLMGVQYWKATPAWYLEYYFICTCFTLHGIARFVVTVSVVILTPVSAWDFLLSVGISTPDACQIPLIFLTRAENFLLRVFFLRSPQINEKCPSGGRFIPTGPTWLAGKWRCSRINFQRSSLFKIRLREKTPCNFYKTSFPRNRNYLRRPRCWKYFDVTYNSLTVC